MLHRASLSVDRTSAMMLAAMSEDEIAPQENVVMLRDSLAEHYQRVEFKTCASMGALVKESMAAIRLRTVGADIASSGDA